MEKTIDLSKVKKCWLVQMLPFRQNDKKNYDVVNNYQEICVEEKFFGIGWSDDYVEENKKIKKMKRLEEIFGDVKSINGEIPDELEFEIRTKIKKILNVTDKEITEAEGKEKKLINLYQYVYKKINPNQISENGKNAGLSKAINAMFATSVGDIVIARLRDGTYLIGQITDAKKFFKNQKNTKENDVLKNIDSNGFSWRCNVDGWVRLQREEVPSDIIGKFLQRTPCTILPTSERIKLLALKLYNEKKKKNDEIPPIILNENNFALSLNSDELEDLVYLYIDENEDKDLILLPSQCKISEPIYEFYLKDRKNPNGKNITCQVKNNCEIDCFEYSKQKDLFEKIYLFSGIGYKEYEEDKKIKIISKKNLFKTLKENINYFNFVNNKRYYEIEEKIEENKKIVIPQEFFINDKKLSLHQPNKKWKNTYSIEYYKDEDGNDMGKHILKVNFYYEKDNSKYEFHYSKEFNCFIIDYKTDDKIFDLIEKIELEMKNWNIF